MAALSPAQAQETRDTSTSSESAGGEIIVTARKRSERLLDVPVAVSAVSSEDLARYASNSLSAISQQVPALVIGESTNQVGGSINLRGVGSGISNPSTETAVTMNFDGVPISYGNAVRLGQIDIQRVEVLKGPQALFYGKNSPGGVISLVSADPGSFFEARLRTGYEFQAEQRFAEAMVSGPLTDTVGARIVGYYSKEDGWFRNIAQPITGVTAGAGAKTLNAEDVFVRGTLTFEPTPATRIKFKINYGQRDRDGVGPTGLAQIVECPNGGVSVFGATDCKLNRTFYDAALTPGTIASDPSFKDGVPFVKSSQFLTSLSVDQDLSDSYGLSSVTGYYRLREQSIDSFSFSNIPYYGASNDVIAKGFSQELRLTSDLDGPLNFMIGGFFQDATFTIGQAFTVDFGTPFLVGSTFYDVHTTAYSGFAQVRYKPVEQIEIAAGGRLSREDKKLTGTSFSLPFEVLDPKKHYNDFSPDITITYKPDSNLTAYAAYREGFTSGGFNTVPTALRTSANTSRPALDLSYDQMTAKGFEVGLKGYLAERQMLFDLVGYTYKYNDLQLSRYDNASFSQLTQNAGGARVQGVEFNLTMQPHAIPGLQVRTSLAYNDAHYTNFIGGCYNGQSISDGCNLALRDPSQPASATNYYTAQDQSGQQLVRAPEWTFSAGFNYDTEFSENLGGGLSFDMNHSSSYLTQTEASPATRQKSYWQFNGTLSLNGGKDKPWELALVGRNLTNRLIRVTGAVVGSTAGQYGTAAPRQGDILASVGAPRSVLLQLTVRSSLFGR
ncbi:TonB-dependent receptor [Novosphingobium beihaiensis]|uniref:TonB-dependent receptor n=1 Tax=Novosphingobium beihaiensis TaxID=2930389 RepID=A0ABT0BL10_9SPHN|nr:TonB-dependent receptor [Novosphingobium beihaiensis]MCJ2185640.1 TonB-dependent receptor [Novosphingobium beihaiensis]